MSLLTFKTFSKTFCELEPHAEITGDQRAGLTVAGNCTNTTDSDLCAERHPTVAEDTIESDVALTSESSPRGAHRSNEIGASPDLDMAAVEEAELRPDKGHTANGRGGWVSTDVAAETTADGILPDGQDTEGAEYVVISGTDNDDTTTDLGTNLGTRIARPEVVPGDLAVRRPPAVIDDPTHTRRIVVRPEGDDPLADGSVVESGWTCGHRDNGSCSCSGGCNARRRIVDLAQGEFQGLRERGVLGSLDELRVDIRLLTRLPRNGALAVVPDDVGEENRPIGVDLPLVGRVARTDEILDPPAGCTQGVDPVLVGVHATHEDGADRLRPVATVSHEAFVDVSSGVDLVDVVDKNHVHRQTEDLPHHPEVLGGVGLDQGAGLEHDGALVLDGVDVRLVLGLQRAHRARHIGAGHLGVSGGCGAEDGESHPEPEEEASQHGGLLE